jgi:hypothetical protein
MRGEYKDSVFKNGGRGPSDGPPIKIEIFFKTASVTLVKFE